MAYYHGMTRSPFTVILRPPKDLAVMSQTNKGQCHINHPIFVILRPPKDLAVAHVFSTRNVFKISPDIRHRTSLPANTDIIFVPLASS
jgi:hypothetical protein